MAKKKAAKKTHTANTNLNRKMTGKEMSDAHNLVDEIMNEEKEGFVIAVSLKKYVKNGRRGEKQQGIIFAEGMDRAKIIGIVAKGVNATTLDLLLAMAEAKKGDEQQHEHDEDGNCLR